MTDVPPPDSPKPPRGRPRRPKGYDDEAVLSEEEVQRRVDVRGGAAPRAAIERAPIRDRRPVTRRPARTGARDSLLLIGLVIVGLVAVRMFLPDGPLTASATASPKSTQAAVAASATALPVETGAPTGGLITLPPTAFVPTASPAPITAPPVTAAPIPTPTLKPGRTPVPTPKPTKTPTATAGPTPPGIAHLNVVVNVINGDGGTAAASAWDVTVTVNGTPRAPFGGSAEGTTVAISPGVSYSVASSGPAGYAKSVSANCASSSGGLPVANQTELCTIFVNDIAPRITVYTIVDNTGGGTLSPSNFAVSVTGTDVRPGQSFGGSSAGIGVTFDANRAITISQSGGGSDYESSPSDGSCFADSNGLALGTTATCTVTFTYIPPAPSDPGAGFLLPFVALPLRTLATWRPNRAG